MDASQFVLNPELKKKEEIQWLLPGMSKALFLVEYRNHGTDMQNANYETKHLEGSACKSLPFQRPPHFVSQSASSSSRKARMQSRGKNTLGVCMISSFVMILLVFTLHMPTLKGLSQCAASSGTVQHGELCAHFWRPIGFKTCTQSGSGTTARLESTQQT